MIEFLEFTVKGPDTVDFFHRVTTQNFKTFQDHEKKGFALLTDRALIETFGLIKKIEKNHFKIFTTDLKTYEKFDRYIFSENMDWTKKDLKCKPGNGTWNFDNLSFSETVSGKEIKPLEACEKLMESLHLFYLPVFSQYNPFELRLDSYVAPLKGCYPGQEVTERMLSKGLEPARKLVFLDGMDLDEESREVFRRDDGALTGEVVWKFKNNRALAVLRKDQAKSGNFVRVGSKELKVEAWF